MQRYEKKLKYPNFFTTFLILFKRLTINKYLNSIYL